MTNHKRAALVCLATGKYFDRFVFDLAEHVGKFWLKPAQRATTRDSWGDEPIVYDTTLFVMTDSEKPVPPGAVKLPAIHGKWPYPTLHRYHQLMENDFHFKDYDYLYQIDSDMLPVAPVTDEIIGGMVGTMSPCGFDWEKERLPFEKNPASLAHVQPEEYRPPYFTGAFLGGETRRVLAMMAELVAAIDVDEEKGIVAHFHEEAHLNRFFIDNPPDKFLLPSYVYPEGTVLWSKQHGFIKRIIVSRKKPEDRNRGLI